jgi:ribose transport system substrate-binding protein
MAFYGIKMLDDLHHYKPKSLAQDWQNDTNSPVPVFVDTGASLIDKGNVDAFASPTQTALNLRRQAR